MLLVLEDGEVCTASSGVSKYKAECNGAHIRRDEHILFLNMGFAVLIGRLIIPTLNAMETE